MRRWAPTGRGIGVRLLLAQAAVLVAGSATTVVVAAIVGPPLFREHLHRAGVPTDSHEQFHAEQAYRYATAISVGVAVAASALTALVVTWYFSRRLRQSLAELSFAANELADGRYDTRVAPTNLGTDFDSVTQAFNTMSQRLGSVESTRRRLFGDLAHEIRTPVAVLQAYMEALEDDVKVMDSETVAVLRDHTARLVRFSEDVAALAHAEEAQASIQPAWMAPDAMVSTALAAAADRCAVKGLDITSRIPAGLPQIWADPHRMGQVLANLIDNAIRHTPAPGRITIEGQARQGALVLEITDTGEGVSAEHLDHLFERFYRVDPARSRAGGGTGIGLSIAKAIVEAHGGRIGARSDGLGTGTTFQISIPVQPEAVLSQ